MAVWDDAWNLAGEALSYINPFDDDAGALAGPRPVQDPDPMSDRRRAEQVGNFSYGGDPSGLGRRTSEIAGQAGQHAGAQTQLAGRRQNTASSFYGAGMGAMAQHPNRLVDPNAYAAAGRQIGQVDAAGNVLMGMAMQPTGPSAAEAQLRAGAAQQARDATSLAASGRGLGGGASTRRLALAQNAETMGRMNADAATLRANEEAVARGQRQQAAVAAGSMYGNAGQLGLGLGQYVSGARGSAEGLATQRGLGLVGAGNDLAGQELAATQGAANTAVSGQQLIGQANQAALAGTMGYEGNITDRRGQDYNVQTAQNQAQAQNQAALLGLAGQGLATVGQAAAFMSDREAKTEIAELDEPVRVEDGRDMNRDSWVGRRPMQRRGSIFLTSAEPEAERGSAENSWVGGTQLKVRDPETGQLVPARSGRGAPRSQAEAFAARLQGEPSAGRSAGMVMSGQGARPPSPEQATEAVRQAPAYSYRYRDEERHGEGSRVGVMAQDLEQTPAGRRAVFLGPDGRRRVDTGELSTINTAAIHGQQERLDEVDAELERIRQKLGVDLRQPDTDELDRSAERERSFGR